MRSVRTILFNILSLAGLCPLGDRLGEECHKLAHGGTLEESKARKILG